MTECAVRRGPTNPALRPKVTRVIVEAVLDELAAVGFGRLSMEGVARRAGSGKAALYRRWANKQEMVLDVWVGATVPEVETGSSGDLLSDVTEIVYGVDARMSDHRRSQIVPDLIAEAKRNPELGDALTNRVAIGRRAHAHTVVAAAIARGEVSADADVEYALDLMAAPIFWRICGLRQRTTPEFLDQVINSVMHALGADRPARERRFEM